MMNFLLGLVAGGLIAGVATISAVRQPEIQVRLGLIPATPAVLAETPTQKEVRCIAPAKTEPTHAAAQADALFSRRRFWYVAP